MTFTITRNIFIFWILLLSTSFCFQIKSGEIFASINQKDGMVVFKDDPEKFNTPEMFLKIQEDITKVMELHKQIAFNEESIMLNPLVILFCFYFFAIILY